MKHAIVEIAHTHTTYLRYRVSLKKKEEMYGHADDSPASKI